MSEVIITENKFASAGAVEGVKATIVQTMIRVHAQAVARAPVDLGQLRSSLMWRKGWASDAFNFPAEQGGGGEVKISSPYGLEGVVGTAVLHGTYQEFGTRYMKAQPFMRPAVDAARGASASEIARTWGRAAMEREFARRTTRTTR